MKVFIVFSLKRNEICGLIGGRKLKFEEIGFDREDTWREYFGREVGEFFSYVKGFSDVFGEVRAEVEGKDVRGLISEKHYKNILFGGLQPNKSDPFAENGLASFYRKILGIRVKNIEEVISRGEQGIPIESATKGSKCTVTETSFRDEVREIKKKLENIYLRLETVEAPEAKNFEKEDSSFGLNAVRRILNSGEALLPRYNQKSFFINSLYSIPAFYASKGYPKLFNNEKGTLPFDEEAKALLEKYGIKLETLFEPDFPDEEIVRKRRIVGLRENTVGTLMRDVIFKVYSLFDISSLPTFFDIGNEFQKYIKYASEKLEESVLKDPFSEVTETIEDAHSTTSFMDLRLRNDLTFYYDNYREFVEGEVEVSSSETLNYSKFVTFLAPHMLFGVAYMRPENEEKFNWECLKWW